MATDRPDIRAIARAALAAEPVTPEPLPDGACGVMGLCELPKGHEGKHETSVDRALSEPAPSEREAQIERIAAAAQKAMRVEILSPSEPPWIEKCAAALYDAGLRAGSPEAQIDVERLARAAQNHETSGIHGPLHCSLRKRVAARLAAATPESR